MLTEQKKLENKGNTAGHIDKGAQANRKMYGTGDTSSLFEPYRGELLLHCYRLLGSLYDAEDTVQECMLRAWRHFDTFKGQGSLRTWLYTIATNVCLDALKKRSSRTLPTVLSAVADPRNPIAERLEETLWLEPLPDSWLAEATENPEARYTRSESVSLAFLAALQLLPPRQRAILLLSDVLSFRAAEIAHLLAISVSAVNSALHRARVTITQHYHTAEQEKMQMQRTDAATNALLARYMQAWETDDVAGLIELLKEDATLSMPPVPSWYRGREAIRTIFLAQPFGSTVSKRWRLLPTRANAQPAFALYVLDEGQDVYSAFGLQLITLAGAQIAEVTIFHGPELVTAFDLPPQLYQ
ncbi:sigma-70 family RNA polymerase sigma factor [Ktedonosporobacter rubrisoli]|uniref:Sigma-70 family RNA polymerase sigma factor n=1 Tax=Ktedonosporobacter rubrisoli TaxID=2509675 RepID=A0A4P6JJU8_KTERU|nr:RNA polymerase subunit sigma-70 [Ktedonosporobacter rubrisoli]QBD75399.1 sigma-70 family RNA polymerase sigma factor [Ktedonosporobacter rubrisoli]